MAKQGRGEEALYTASVASSFGGVIGTIILVLFCVPLAQVSLRFGPPEFFWMAIFGLTIIASLSNEAMLKGFAGGLIGLMISMIGMAPIGGDIRFNLGIVSLQGGVELVSVLIGFFCIPEVFRMASAPNQKPMVVDKVRGSKDALRDAWNNVVKHMGNTVRSSVLGALIGILPGAGGNISNIVAYNEAKRASKEPETFGKGNAQGVVATESANNATVEGALVPLLTMGIPGSPPAAIIFGALLMQGIQPGPELFSKNGDITYAFMFSFFVCNILMAVFGILAISAFFYAQLGEDFSMFGLFFPERMLPLLTAFGVAILAKGFIRPTGLAKPVFQINRTMILAMAVGTLWVLLLEKAGFVATSAVSVFALQMAYTPRDERSVKCVLLNLVGSFAVVLFFDYVFVQILGVTLPDGAWWE